MPSYASGRDTGGLAARIYRGGKAGSYRLRCQLVAGRPWRCASASVPRLGGIDEDLSNANGQLALHIRLRVSASLDYCATYEGEERWIGGAFVGIWIDDVRRKRSCTREWRAPESAVRTEVLARVCGEGVSETRRGAKTEEPKRAEIAVSLDECAGV